MSTIIVIIIHFPNFSSSFGSNPGKLIHILIIHIVICVTPGLVVIIDLIDWLEVEEK